MGRLYWGHTFDFMVVAYEEVNSKPSGEREAAVVARDADPAAYAREWLFNKGAFAPWRLIGACCTEACDYPLSLTCVCCLQLSREVALSLRSIGRSGSITRKQAPRTG